MRDWDCYLDDYVDYDDTMMMTESEIRELIVDEHDRKYESDFEEYIHKYESDFEEYIHMHMEEEE